MYGTRRENHKKCVKFITKKTQLFFFSLCKIQIYDFYEYFNLSFLSDTEFLNLYASLYFTSKSILVVTQTVVTSLLFALINTPVKCY